MEIIKQLFDVGELSDACDDLSEVSVDYKVVQVQESKYRAKAYTLEVVLNDAIETGFLLCQSRLKGSIDNDNIQELHQGIKQIQSYLLGAPYRIGEARLCALKSALIATVIKNNNEKVNLIVIRYDNSRIQEMADIGPAAKYAILNKLNKATQTETFYCWSLISRM